jgi:hypothetical protein
MNELLLALWLYQTWKLPEQLRAQQPLAPLDLTAVSAEALKAAAQCAAMAGFSL